MIISSGKMSVLENKNKTAKFFGDVEVGDIIEVRVNLNVHTTHRVSDSLVTIHNLTKGTERTDAPIYIHKGLAKLAVEPFSEDSDLEYQRGYNSAYDELRMAYFGGYIEELFEDGEEEE